MKIKELSAYLEKWAPLSLQESYDNSGLLVGNPETEISGVLISLDCTEAVLDEAISKNCNVIVCHHPIIFGGIKKLTGRNYVERTIIKAIQNNLAIYAIHTNLDNVSTGVNRKISEMMGLQNARILSPISGKLRQLTTFIPKSHTEKVRDALFAAGAGHIGNYSEASFISQGTGSFKPEEGSNPFIGSHGFRQYEEEDKLELIFENYRQQAVLAALRSAHPYEEIAYNIITLENSHQDIGAGMIGDLPKPMECIDFLKLLKDRFKLSFIRHTGLCKDKIQKVALCGGSGFFLLKDAIAQKADIFITGDVKYHDFFDADGQIILADIGHYESEQFTKELLLELIQKQYPELKQILCETNTNPLNYF